eukprot:3456485-Prymnesium_polylepis.1
MEFSAAAGPGGNFRGIFGGRGGDVPQLRVGRMCRKVSFCRTIVLRHLAALGPSTASGMKAIVWCRM